MRQEKKITSLAVSESFYSIQCEGHTTGYPAYFMRLKGCNLMCGGVGGELMKTGEATWWCDTEVVWKQGFEKQFYRIVQEWDNEKVLDDKSVLDWIMEGRIHLIWTGGEPTIPKHQKGIAAFHEWFKEYCFEKTGKALASFNEIETNGTMYISDDLFELLDQINCSVKLQNSGMRFNRRVKQQALERIMEHENYWFKFVISTDECLKEIERDFIKPFNIPHDKVLMMPGLDSQDNYHERTRFCLEMAKKHGYIGLSRLHVSAWDKLTGV